MARYRPPYLVRDVSRHKQVRWYYRRDGKRIRLPDQYGSKEFWEAYKNAVAGKSVERDRAKSGTLAWLITRYKEARPWADLSLATRRQRDGILRRVSNENGDVPFAAVTRSKIKEGMDKRETPAAARHFLETMRGMFRWAVDADIATDDPTRDLKAPKKKTDGFHTWTDEEISLFESKWKLGTRERLAFDLMLYSGLRRSDAVIAGKQHIKDGVMTLRTAKTGETVSIPVLPPLAASLAAGPTGDLAFIVGERGNPMTKESFGNWFRKVCTATGLPHCSAHGLRKAGATRAAEAGATVPQLEAMFGWRGGGMASLYTRKANRKALAQAGFDKLTGSKT